MQVFFCDSCSKRVTEGELAEGEGVRVGDLAFCRFCCERPEVQEVLERASEMMEAGRARSVGSTRRTDAASKSGLHRLVRGHPVSDYRGGRGTPHHGHGRAKVKTPPRGAVGSTMLSPPRGKPATPRPKTPPRGNRATPRPPRPVSPVPSGPSFNPDSDGVRHGGHRTPHRLRKVALPRKGGGLFALYCVVGIAVGFIIVAAAPTLAGRLSAKPRVGRATQGTREVPIRWTGPETTADGQVKFEGKCTVARAEGRGSPQALCWVEFPSGGPWSVRVNGRIAYHAMALDGSRAAAGRLRPGVNTIVATCGSGSAEDPPRLFVGRGR